MGREINIKELQIKFRESKNHMEIPHIDGKTIFNCRDLIIAEDEKFKKHPFLNLHVSNYGRVMQNEKVLVQKDLSKGYLYIDYYYDILEIYRYISNNKYDKTLYTKKNVFRTPVAFDAISIDNTKNI